MRRWQAIILTLALLVQIGANAAGTLRIGTQE